MFEILRRILTSIWKIWFAFCFATVFLILFPLFWIVFKIRFQRGIYILKIILSKTVCGLVGIFPKVINHNVIHHFSKPVVFVCNHSSYLDILLFPVIFNQTSIFMAKAELLKIPLFNMFFKYSDIPVDRKRPTSGKAAFDQAADKLRNGMHMIIFPEGTISSSGKLLPFKNGPFKLAIDMQVPLLPLAFKNNWKYLQNGGFFKSLGQPGFPELHIGPPIQTQGLSNQHLEEVKQKVLNFMQLHSVSQCLKK